MAAATEYEMINLEPSDFTSYEWDAWWHGYQYAYAYGTSVFSLETIYGAVREASNGMAIDSATSSATGVSGPSLKTIVEEVKRRDEIRKEVQEMTLAMIGGFWVFPSSGSASSSSSSSINSISAIWDTITQTRIETLHPEIRQAVIDFILDAQSQEIYLRVSDAYRSYAEQQVVYDNGASGALPGQSYHNYGLAIDVCEITDGQMANNSWARLQQISSIGKAHGFEWGGDWTGKNCDPPHYQMTFGYSWQELLSRYKAGNMVNGYVNLH